ncbi:ABC transporter ATP-binding protein [Deinococcus sp. MIMF12]|uniref:ABC transporter ATP-binding protein n=1 Tax=Deinococcus rhizophilus TaxID=3049544 RepID=A0ABT7JEP1_9DEIO|nr:ABC transporter ATP-binding protein [Deinococcus rhizophilus]MDL2343037.1 ABC transporter ATP-binding protein [Deinococcus rhizophilus]
MIKTRTGDKERGDVIVAQAAPRAVAAQRSMIEIRGLSQSYGPHRVLDAVNLEVAPFERCALVGRNGAGKSTLIHTMLGLMPARRGQIHLHGISTRKNGWKRYVSYLPEKFHLYQNLTGYENLTFFNALTAGALDEARAEEVLRAVSLWEVRHTVVNTYSKGMLQRLGLALMLYFDTEIIILDEPTSGLDPIGREEILTIIRNLTDKTILMASHHFDEIRRVCTHVAMLEDGKVTKYSIDEFSTLYFSGDSA